MKYSNIIILLFILFFSLNLHAQQQKELTNEEVKEVFNALNKKLEGTYQIQFKGRSRMQPSISYEMLKEIESKRDQSKTIYIDYNDHYQVKVLSRKEINSLDFKPIEEKVIYKTK